MTASLSICAAAGRPRRPFQARVAFGRFGGPAFSGIHAVVIALMRHRVTGAIIGMMGALGFVGWAMAYVL